MDNKFSPVVSRFIVTLIVTLSTIWGAVEAFTYFTDDTLKNILGSNWWLVFCLPPLVIAFLAAMQHYYAITAEMQQPETATHYQQIADEINEELKKLSHTIYKYDYSEFISITLKLRKYYPFVSTHYPQYVKQYARVIHQLDLAIIRVIRKRILGHRVVYQHYIKEGISHEIADLMSKLKTANGSIS